MTARNEMNATAKSKPAPAAPAAQAAETKRTPAVTCTIEYDPAGNVTRQSYQFADGRLLAVTANTFPHAIWEHAKWHGIKQKLMDAAALSRNPETGRSATIGDKYDAMKTVFDRMAIDGNWNAVTRAGAGPKIDGTLSMALVRLYPAKSPAALRGYLGDKSAAEQTAMRGNPRIAPMIATIVAEMAEAANTDFDAQLAGLEGIE